MPFTMDDFHDLIRLIETRPEWRTELRRLVLTEELLAAPDQLAALRTRSEEQFQALVEAQQRTNLQLTTLTERVTALAAAQERMDNQLTALTERVTALAAAQERMDNQLTALTEQVAALTRVVHTLTVDVGTLKGKSLEADYRSRGHAYLSRVVRRPHVLTSDELMTIIEDARDRGLLSDIEAQDLYETDLVVRGRRSEDGTEVYLVVEVSWGVGPHDVEWAVQRARVFSHIGLATIPVVAGEHILPEAHERARQSQVWQVTDGRAVPPVSSSN
jgi:hypothetical protein